MIPQETVNQILDTAQIADVDKVIDGRATGVHLDVVRGMGLELFLFGAAEPISLPAAPSIMKRRLLSTFLRPKGYTSASGAESPVLR